MTGAGADSILLVAPLLALTIGCGVLAQYATVAALQLGGAIETIGLMGLIANAVQTVGGVLVFGDHSPPAHWGSRCRSAPSRRSAAPAS